MNDTKLVKAIKAHIKWLKHDRLEQAQADLNRAVNERAMDKRYWEGVIFAVNDEIMILEKIIEEK
jgi:hypothetical protein